MGIWIAAIAWLSIGNASVAFAKENPSAVLIPQLEGIVLLGGGDPLEVSDALVCDNAIEYVDLELPGSKEMLRNQLSVFLHSPATQETLFSIKQVIADYYRAANHPFVSVNVPPQDVTTGVVQVVVQESKLGKVCVEGNRWTSSKRLERYTQAQPGQPLDQSRLLQGVSFINRNPFRRVDLVFAPGVEKGTTDLILATKDRFPLRVYVGMDDTGVQPVGEGRWYTGFNWGNAFGLDHILSYQFTSALSMRKFQAHTAEYTALLSWRHVLKIYGGYSEVHPDVSGGGIKNHGWSLQTSARYIVPLQVYRYLDHAITAGGDFKRTNNTFEFSEDLLQFGKNVNLTQLVVEYNGNYERNSFRIDFDSEVYWSPGRWLSDQTNADYGSLRPGAINQWVYFRGSLRYLQKLPASFSLSILAAGQVSSQPLLPSEQFGLGGYNTVRGYQEREINVDNAALLSAELRSPGLPITRWIKRSSKVADALQFLVFVDSGWGSNIQTVPGTHKWDYLIGAGPGVRYTLEPYFTGRLDWGIRLHNQADLGGGTSMFHFGVTASI